MHISMEALVSAENAPSDAPKAQQGCLVCRSRKVRCDRTTPGCTNCSRLGVPCPGYATDHESISRSEIVKSADDIFRAAGVQKRRVGACNECRTSKNKCTKAKPACQRCLVRGLACVYPNRTHERSISIPETSPIEESFLLTAADRSVENSTDADDSRLYSDALPEDPSLRSDLVNAYFDRVHPLRCLSFIHKPSFMHSLDRASVIQDYGEPLLYAMCALGATCLSDPSLAHRPDPPGVHWADKARREVLCEFHVPTIQHLMTLLLLCEYGLRTDQNALIFTLTGCAFRAMRLLGLDAPSEPANNDQTPANALDREIKNRIVWACYTIDALVASGVDQNSSWRDEFPRVPLPCSDHDFLSQTPAPAQHLSPMLQPESMSNIRNLSLSSLSIVLIRLRSQILSLIRKAPEPNPESWDSSNFINLLQQLELFYQSLPERYQLTDLNMYILDDQHLLGAVFDLHFMYHSAVSDLTRISLPGFNFPLAAAFRNISPEFRSQCQERCRFHAKEVSQLVRRGFEYGRGSDQRRVVFDGAFCADASFESAKIQIVYTATISNNLQSIEVTRHNLRTNLRLLETLHAGKEGESRYFRTIIPLCMLFGFRDIAEEWKGMQTPPLLHSTAEVTGSADVHYLSNSARFRLALSEIETRRSADSHDGASSSRLPPESPQDWSQSTPAHRHHHHHHHQPNSQPAPNPGLEQQQQISDFPRYTPLTPNSMQMPPGPVQPPQQHLQYAAAAAAAAGLMMPALPMIRPSTEEYIRTADELSNFLTWDNSELNVLPPWTGFDMNGNFHPGT
ncbi:fungal-specific transcription factor domain-containing protein [Xylariomycetidae sp. FL0641]|nr:fungal-specific transcription factor domain-containing protein [Xylariomycetidae sp. FL0641]